MKKIAAPKKVKKSTKVVVLKQIAVADLSKVVGGGGRRDG